MCAFIVILGKRCCFCNMDKYNLILFFFFFLNCLPCALKLWRIIIIIIIIIFSFVFMPRVFFFSTVVLEPTVFPIPSALSKKKKKSFCFPLS